MLLEGAPAGIDADAVGGRMAAMPGVTEVHDLHIWTITSGFPALSAHVLVGQGEDCHARRRELADDARARSSASGTPRSRWSTSAPGRLRLVRSVSPRSDPSGT